MVTDLFIVGVVALISGVDVWFAVGKPKTISRRLRKHGRSVAAIPFAWGYLGGHFFGPLVGFSVHIGLSLGALVVGGALASLLHRFVLQRFTASPWLGVLWLLVGIGAGTYLWPQTTPF